MSDESEASLNVATWRDVVGRIRDELRRIDEELATLPVGQSKQRMAARDRRHARHELGVAIASLARAEAEELRRGGASATAPAGADGRFRVAPVPRRP